jgi:ATP-binding cassette subfamily B protein
VVLPPMWWVAWRLIRYRPWLYLAAATLALAVALIDLIPGVVNQAFFDAVSGREPAGIGAWTAVALTLLVPLLRTVVKASAVMSDVALRFVVDSLVRKNLLLGIFRRPGARAIDDAPGAVANHFRDDAAQAQILVTLSYDVLTAALFVVAALWIMARTSPEMTLFVFLPLVAVIVIAQRAFERMAGYRRASRAATSDAAGLLGEALEAVEAVQLAGAEERVVAHFRRLSDARRRAMLRDSVATRLLEAVTSNAVGIGTGVILLLGAGAMRDGRFTVGDFALFAYYLAWVTYFIESLGRALPVYRLAGIGFGRMAALVAGGDGRTLAACRPLRLRGPLPEPRVPPLRRPADRLHLLEVDGLTYRHPGSGRGIEGASLRVPRGALVVVTGRVASGKTTLLRAVLGLLPADGGAVRWNGEPVRDGAAFFVPPRAAYVPQVPRLFSATLAENVRLGLPVHDEALAQALHAAALDPDLQLMERGPETLVGPRGVRLSGGQVQRTATARAVVRQPELLVLDDLSSALDGETERLVWGRLRGPEQGGRRTCLAVSHRRAALERADQIVVLAEGRVVGAGTLAGLWETCAELRALWEADSAPGTGGTGSMGGTERIGS